MARPSKPWDGRSVWEFALPVMDTAGQSMSYRRMQWAKAALALAGGYTRMPTGEGRRRDERTGTVYRDSMIGFRVLATEKIKTKLVQIWFDTFPDQRALYITRIGTAEIIERSMGHA